MLTYSSVYGSLDMHRTLNFILCERNSSSSSIMFPSNLNFSFNFIVEGGRIRKDLQPEKLERTC